ncbi:hypothetical protein CJ030_MR4G018822 [Morella rubra]|uniref:PGG domain-containing protein n=1 Tax=Morella rubra TaxID=262757 RepID=A0A6A1VSN1_9ROSI|nr:hypothetical protein CJ030_MR4G018822 [Morella rubra]
MDKRLTEAAERGDVDVLYQLIENDIEVLDNIDKFSCVHTPLHAAASAGQTHFAGEIMILKPSFARKLNEEGLTPMHLALRAKNTQLALQLFDVNTKLGAPAIRVKGKGGMTSLHYAAEIGDLQVLAKVLEVCPESVLDVTIQRETALHIALKHRRFVAFKFLAARSFCLFSVLRNYLNDQDEEGNTLLHIAVQQNLTQEVRFLIVNCLVHVNIRNKMNLTPLDVLGVPNVVQAAVDNREIRNLLRKGEGTIFSIIRWVCNSLRARHVEVRNLKSEVQNALLVVGALLATVTYQAVLSPPGGVWQDDSTSTQQQTTTASPHQPGQVMMGISTSFIFFILNSLIFHTGFFLLVLLLPRPSVISWGFITLLSFLLVCYFVSTSIILPYATLALATDVGLIPYVLWISVEAVLWLKKWEIRKLAGYWDYCRGCP